MSLAKLTSLSTQTLSLLLERQRLQTFTPGGDNAPPTLHAPQIARNLRQLRTGILALEAREGRSEAAGLLRNQYERLRAMLGDEIAEREGVDRFVSLYGSLSLRLQS
jgi:syntaxin 8